jgi:hypothetical protein
MSLFVQLCACLRCSDFRILRFLRGGSRPLKFTPLTNFLAQAQENSWFFVDFIQSQFLRLNLGSLITCRGYYDTP